MTREELKLNDFEGFDRYLKTLEAEEKTGRRTFYDEKTEIFTPPILKPETLPEYQLDHYALWMVICRYGLREKPKFCDTACHPQASCYACEWRSTKTKTPMSCVNGCPLVPDYYMMCGVEFDRWASSRNLEDAYDIAHLQWRET